MLRTLVTLKELPNWRESYLGYVYKTLVDVKWSPLPHYHRYVRGIICCQDFRKRGQNVKQFCTKVCKKFGPETVPMLELNHMAGAAMPYVTV